MALLDVSSILIDPDLTDRFSVRRRKADVDIQGRLAISEQLFTGIIGVITTANPNDLDRQDDFSVFTRTLSVVTRFRLRGEVKGYQPDVIVWHGNNFVVKHIDLYPQFGSGFYQAECESMDRTDNISDIILTGQMAFNSSNNSGLLALELM